MGARQPYYSAAHPIHLTIKDTILLHNLFLGIAKSILLKRFIFGLIH